MSGAIQPAAPANHNGGPALDDTTIATRVGQYIKVRDAIEAISERHKAELAPYKEALAALNGVLLGHLNTAGVNSVASPQGTFYRNRRVSVTVADSQIFRDWITTQGAWNLVDIRANKTAVEAYLTTQEVMPPGLNMTVMFEAGVRRPANSKE